MEVVRLMALLFAHINFQIRHGFRSRIFFGLKNPFSVFDLTGYDALRRNQLILSPWQHQLSPLFPLPGEEDSVFEYVFRIGSDPAASIGCEIKSFPAWAGIKGWVEVAKDQSVLSSSDFHQQPISTNLNYI
jgi:hypothetical protein